MADLPTTCPSCHGTLSVSRLRCDGCHTQLEGEFHLPPLLRLSASDLEFVTRFVSTSGSLKEMAKQYGQSYPTIRNRLDDIMARLGPVEPSGVQERQAILDRIAKGTLSVAAAERELRRLSK